MIFNPYAFLIGRALAQSRGVSAATATSDGLISSVVGPPVLGVVLASVMAQNQEDSGSTAGSTPAAGAIVPTLASVALTGTTPGQQQLTFTGSNFGTNAAVVTVNFQTPGNAPFAASPTVVTSTSFSLTLPANQLQTIQGTTATITVSVNQVNSNSLSVQQVGIPAKVVATSGSGQNATIGTAFTAPLVATVTDSGGNPVPGVTVTFTPPGSGPSGAFAAGANTANTNASGVATAQAGTFTANSTAGAYNVVASAAPAPATANFALTNNVGPAAEIVTFTGTPQHAQIGESFQPMGVLVTDNGGNPVPGVIVTFAAPVVDGTATGTFTGNVSTMTAPTGSTGVATSAAATFTANDVKGPFTVTAAFPGAAAPAVFNLVNRA